MRRQDSKSVAGLFAAVLAAAAVSACGGALARSGPSPATPPAVAVSPGCDSTAECSGQEVCVDPRYPLCGAVPACEETGLIRCGCACVAIGATTGCAADEVRGASGCCEPRPCTADPQCGRADSRCLAGRCSRRGTCQPLPP